MGKKRKDSDSDDKKKKKKKDKDKKKKDKKKKDKKKKKAKKESSSSDSSSSEEEDKTQSLDRAAKDGQAELAATPKAEFEPPPVNLDALPPLEDGILRFEFTLEEKGALGVRFSGGSPPMILSVAPDSFASKKGIPVNYEVHAINGLALVQQNQQRVMHFLKSRPVVLDVRPLGWKPPEKMKELKRRQQQEEAEQKAKMAVEKKRREQASARRAP
ncbi:LZTR1 [Symbiodinium sp. CCMP2592]|nr:LZTR1 [Symbiodinium sp. CCMP2592]